MPNPTSAAEDASAAGIRFPAVGRKKVTGAFDGGRLTLDSGALLRAQAEREMRIRPVAHLPCKAGPAG